MDNFRASTRSINRRLLFTSALAVTPPALSIVHLIIASRVTNQMGLRHVMDLVTESVPEKVRGMMLVEGTFCGGNIASFTSGLGSCVRPGPEK